MVKAYITNPVSGNLDMISEPIKGCWINMVKPTEEEIKEICEKTGAQEHLLRYPLDILEKAHIDIEDESVLIVVDSPYTEMKDNEKVYTTLPIGMMLVKDDYFITISQGEIDSIKSILKKEKSYKIETHKKSRLVFQILYDMSKDYIRYLTYINNDLEYFEGQMKKSMRNKELLKIMKFQKSMIYFDASLKANHGVLEKLNRGKTIKLYDEDEEILEDTLIESRQAIEMISTYSEILNGTIDMFGTIVSNNLNIVMKYLTSITILIALPTMISGILGMNVEFPFNTGVPGFWGAIAVSVIITIIATIWLKKKDML